MHVTKMISLLIIAALTGGCASPVPVAKNFPRTYQKVARTAHHWDVVASDVAARTAMMMAEKKPLQARDLYIPVAQRNSFFDSAFRDFLIDHLVQKGMPVIACPVDESTAGFQTAPAIQVQFETKVMRHAEMPTYQPGALTMLAAGIYALRGISTLDNLDQRAIGTIAGMAAVDTWIAQMPDETRTELIITATIQDGNRFVMRRSLIYYVPDGDWELFANRPGKPSSCGQARQTSRVDAAEGHVSNAGEQAMARLRQEKVERDMLRFNQDYRPPKRDVLTAYLD